MMTESDYAEEILIEHDFFICHREDSVHFTEGYHYHNGFEIHFTLTGAATYQVDGKEYLVDSGSIGLFNLNDIHRVSIDRSKLHERYVILFKPRLIEEFSEDFAGLLDLYLQTDCLQLNNENKTKIRGMCEDLIKANEDYEQNELYIKIKVIEIILTIKKMSENNLSKIAGINNVTVLSDIIAYIKQCYMEKISLEYLCEKYVISKSTLIRMFKKNMGVTPNQYIIFTRILKSRELLEKGHSVKEVAAMTGYNNESNFIRKFKEIQGESPKQYSLNVTRQQNDELQTEGINRNTNESD